MGGLPKTPLPLLPAFWAVHMRAEAHWWCLTTEDKWCPARGTQPGEVPASVKLQRTKLAFWFRIHGQTWLVFLSWNHLGTKQAVDLYSQDRLEGNRNRGKAAVVSFLKHLSAL